MSKLKAFSNSILNANGPAQILGYSFWGVLMAGMLWDFAPEALPQEGLAAWATISVLVLFASIWASKAFTKWMLVMDMFISAVVLSIVCHHDPEVMRIMYTVQSDGHFIKSYVSDYFTITALAWMVIHGAYLANLTQRQMLEQRRFNL